MVCEPAQARRDLITSMGIPCCLPNEVENRAYDNVVVAVNRKELVEQYVEKAADAGTVLLFGGLIFLLFRRRSSCSAPEPAHSDETLTSRK